MPSVAQLALGVIGRFGRGQSISGNPNWPFSRFLATTDWSRVELRSRGAPCVPWSWLPAHKSWTPALPGRDERWQLSTSRARWSVPWLAVHTAPLAAGILEVPQVTILADDTVLNVTAFNTAEMGTSLVAGGATWDNLQGQLLQGYDILYLAAHGALLPTSQPTRLEPGLSSMRPYLLLEKGDGSYDRRPGQDVWNLVAGLPMARCPAPGGIGFLPEWWARQGAQGSGR